MSASFPGAVKTFATRNNGEPIQASHVDDLQDEVNAIEDGYLNGKAPLNSSNASVNVLTLNGGQIVFPALQAASAGANTLDDYEEGTWTPVIGGAGGQSGQTYTTQIGHYVKVGKLVTVQLIVTLSAKGTITGAVQVQGLPFASENAADYATGAAIWGNTVTSFINVVLLILPNISAISVRGIAAAGVTNNTDLLTADIGNTTFFIGSLTYRASA